jgi:chromosome segregation ATPase
LTESTDRAVERALDAQIEAQHKWLVSRDHNVGVEAEIGRLNRDLVQLTRENAEMSRRVTSLTRRRDTLQANLGEARQQLKRVRGRNAELTRRVEELEQSSRSFARRVAGRLRRAVR